MFALCGVIVLNSPTCVMSIKLGIEFQEKRKAQYTYSHRYQLACIDRTLSSCISKQLQRIWFNLFRCLEFQRGRLKKVYLNWLSRLVIAGQMFYAHGAKTLYLELHSHSLSYISIIFISHLD